MDILISLPPADLTMSMILGAVSSPLAALILMVEPFEVTSRMLSSCLSMLRSASEASPSIVSSMMSPPRPSFKALGVSIATILPWSIMAILSQA